MSHFLRCPLGHRWQIPRDDATLTEDGPRCPSCGGLGVLDSPDDVPTPAAPPDATLNAPAPPSGADLPSLEGYTLLRQIGRGGFGVVYLARQTFPERVVAVKLLHAGATDAAQAERFEREASMLARLDHGNVVRVLAGGKSADGRLFLALEYVDGGALHVQLRKQPQPPHEAAQLVETLARAVHYLHEQGIIHRDLKPSNVLLRRDGTLKLTDFGLARYREDGHSLTATGGILGTPSYMAPEQARGQAKTVTPAADVYALGAILYECLTGRPPFLGATPLDTLHHVLTDEPVPPARLQPTVPPALETVCLKCLEKKPERRYASAAELADDLRRHLEGQAVAARRVGPLGRLGRWCRRHPAGAGLAAAVVLALAGLVAYLWQAAQVAEARAAGETAERRTREARAGELGETLRSRGAEADALVLQARYVAGRPDRRDEAFGAIRTFGKLRADADRAAEGLRGLGASAELLARHDRARWQAWTDRLRTEATLWLTGARLQRGRELALPERPAGQKFGRRDLPALALTPDGQRLALLYPGETEVLLLDPEGKVRDRLDVPREVAQRAIAKEIHKGSARHGETGQTITVTAARLAYTGPNHLEYQVGQELVSWDLARAKEPRRVQLPPHRPARLPAGQWNTSSPRFLAAVEEGGAAVTVRGWTPGARPAVVWRAGTGEQVLQIVFSGDRALFIRSDRRLAVVDAAGGSAAEASLDDPEQVEVGELVPCPGGVLLAQRRVSKDHAEAPRLIFWSAALPEARVQALPQDEAPRSLALGGAGPDRLTVVGTPDHFVQAWRGPTPLWQTGLPYLGERAGRVSRHLRVAAMGIPLQSAGFTRRLRQVQVPGRPSPWLEVVAQYVVPLQPYRWWGFGPDGTLVVERPMPAADGQSRVLTELYSRDGRLESAYPAEGKGRILVTSDDRRLAVVVADEGETQATLEVWSLAERRRLGDLGRHALPPGPDAGTGGRPFEVVVLTSPTRKDYVLLTRPYPPGAGAGAELEVWRIGAGVERVGQFALPAVCTAAFLTPDETRAVVCRPRAVATGPYFARVIDLGTAARVCDLEGFDATGNLDDSLLTATHMVHLSRQGLSEDPNDPYRASSWDLRTGRRTALDALPWQAGEAPRMALSPDGSRVVLCGRLHDTGAGYAQLYDLERGRLLWQSAHFPGPARPRLEAFFANSCLVKVENHPEKGKHIQLGVRWADGRQPVRPTAPTAEMVGLQSDSLGSCSWILWRDRKGFFLQGGHGSKRLVRLEKAARGYGNLVWPLPEGGPLAMQVEEGAGLWDAGSGRQTVRFPPGHRCVGFDAARRWALTVAPAAGEVRVWDTRTGVEIGRWKPRADALDLTQVRWEEDRSRGERRGWELDPGGKRLAVLVQGLLQVWDLEADQRVLLVPAAGHLKPVDCVAQHAGAGLVASAGADGVILLWRRDSGQLVRALPAHRAAVTALAFSPDGKTLASASAAGDVALHDRAGETAWSVAVTPAVPVTCLAFEPAGRSLLAGTQDGRLLRLAARGGRLADTHATGLESVRALALSPDGSVAAVGGPGGVRLYDAARLVRRKGWTTGTPAASLAFVGGGRLLAVAGKAVEFWDTQADPSVVWTLEVPQGPVRSLAMNEATGELAVADQGTAARVYNLTDLHGRLAELGLGLDAFPASRWPRPAPPATEKGPGPVAWRRLAEERFERRQWPRLLWACCAALAEEPDNARLWYLRGEAEARAPGRLGDAVGAYSRALELKADDASAWLRRAAAYARLGRWEEADRDYARALKLGAVGWDAWYGRAEALSERKNLEAALRYLARAVEINPDRAAGWRLRGLVHARLGRGREGAGPRRRAAAARLHAAPRARAGAAGGRGCGALPGRVCADGEPLRRDE
jgi:WD40 repeat protein